MLAVELDRAPGRPVKEAEVVLMDGLRRSMGAVAAVCVDFSSTDLVREGALGVEGIAVATPVGLVGVRILTRGRSDCDLTRRAFFCSPLPLLSSPDSEKG